MPTFYRVLQEQDEEKQIAYAQELRDAFTTLIDAADPHGPLFLGPDLSFVDVQVAPWILRLRRVLKPYRGWPDPEQGTRWAAWVDALESNEHVKATTSGDELYLDSYERYAREWIGCRPVSVGITLTYVQKTVRILPKSPTRSTREEAFRKWTEGGRGEEEVHFQACGERK